MILEQIKTEIHQLSNPEKALGMARFFKTGKGEYGEGDIFIGVSTPNLRSVAKKYFNEMSLEELPLLLQSEIHEHRALALIILILKFDKAETKKEQELIVDLYLKMTDFINNWDLVDISCYKILGKYCFENQKDQLLFNLADSDKMWEKRIAIVSTMYYIKKDQLEITPQIVLKNIQHSHDLMHKANGWLLREMGKRNEQNLINFLDEYTTVLPRTSLRYAIERLTPAQRKYYLQLK